MTVVNKLSACWLFVLGTTCIYLEDNNSPVVYLDQGIVEGRVLFTNTTNKIKYYSFQGIPYAEPPVGKLRFEAPRPILKPRTRWKAIEEGSSCVQITISTTETIGNEDCLYLNIYTTFTTESNDDYLRPVMFYIHGGGFFFGSGNYSTTSSFSPFGPDRLLEEDVLVVTINYRLNVFGFFNTQDGAVPGNVGLKDQLAALIWTNKNIVYFGGDPGQVTVVGHSAGAASIFYLMQSPLAKDLFNKAVILSGSNLNRWSFQENPRQTAFKLGQLLGIATNDSTELVDELRKIDSYTLARLTRDKNALASKYPFFAQPFLPSFELDRPDASIVYSNFDIQRYGHFYTVPTLIGHTALDGSYGFFFVDGPPYVNLSDFDRNPNLVVPAAMNVPLDTTASKATAGIIRDQYFSSGNFSERNNFLGYLTEELFVRGIKTSLNFLKRVESNVYFYEITYPGIGHGDELPYIWLPKGAPLFSETQKLFSKRLVKLWTNFIKYGHPTPNQDNLITEFWPKAGSAGFDETVYMEIGDQLKAKLYPKLNETIWKLLFQSFGKRPYVIH